MDSFYSVVSSASVVSSQNINIQFCRPCSQALLSPY